ncbi:hypothetical protein Leryth_009809 [Lithospermum erythrorhizon]|nr:hypothetical protein Leryth_009809 [Lithospermum erythrorhizon]
MKFLKCEKTQKILILRWIKTMFVLMTMFVSLMLVSTPVIIVLADALLPSALLSASLSSSSLSFNTLSSNFNNYDFRYSLIDIPFISIIRSVIILCVYSLCDGAGRSRGPYLSIATMCSMSSLAFVSLKASYVFSNETVESSYVRLVEVALLFLSSLAFAVGHVVVAYRISCRERRKLLVYKIDIEAVSACKNGFPRYQKLLKEERVK